MPDGWALVPPGDPAFARRIKAAGDQFAIAEKRVQNVFSRAPGLMERIRADLEAERSREGFAMKNEADARRCEKARVEYAEDFHGTVVTFLAFHPTHADLADRLARAVTDYAMPVESGTVARTKRIPVEQRAEATAIAWMRHQTTGYDRIATPR